VRELRHEMGAPVEAIFDFTTGDCCWSVPVGEGLSVAEGLAVRAGPGHSRAMSPALDLQADATRYIVLELTAPVATDERLSASMDFMVEGSDELHSRPFAAAAGQAGLYNIDMARSPAWQGKVTTLMVTLGEPGEYVLHSLRASPEPAAGALDGPATGLEYQTEGWRREYRLPHSPTRIDVAKQAPPETRPVASDWTVAM